MWVRSCGGLTKGKAQGHVTGPAEPLQRSLATTYSQPFTPHVYTKGNLSWTPSPSPTDSPSPYPPPIISRVLHVSIPPPCQTIATGPAKEAAEDLRESPWFRERGSICALRSGMETTRFTAVTSGWPPSLLKSISLIVSELRRPHVLHLSPAAPSVKCYVSSGCAFTEAWRPHTASTDQGK